jgi:DNA-binding transcriptional MerR regulator/methylmalonyl-CoA mutase cobalamin-binding subunit
VPRSPAKARAPRTKPVAQAQSAPHDAYPLKTVSRMTGLTPDIIRAWERRHAVVSPLRGPRGARLYSSADVARLHQLGTLVARGRSIGDVAGLDADALSALAQDRNVPVARMTSDVSADEPIRAVLAALGRFDSAAVERVLGDSLMALGIGRFVSGIGGPLLHRIGELWESGELSVAEEHVASAAIRSLFGGLIRMQMPARPPSFLLTAPSGERHELGLSMVALQCLQAGLAVTYAGVDLPAEEIVHATLKARVPVVGLSLVSGANRPTAVEQIRRIEAGLPVAVEIWLGGHDATAVAHELGKSRALVLQDMPAIEREIARIARQVRGESV